MLQKERDEARALRAEECANGKLRLELEATKGFKKAEVEEECMKLQHKLKQEEAMRLEAIKEKAIEREERNLQIHEDKRVKVEEGKMKQVEMQAHLKSKSCSS